MWKPVIVFAAALLAAVSSQQCVRRRSAFTGDDDGHYCVCNSTYCDSTPILFPGASTEIYKLVTSSKAGLRFHVSQGIYRNVISIESSIGKITLDPGTKLQKIIGFGGAITDSVGLNINSLSENAGNLLVKSYFGTEGIEYSIIRTPMGGSDFSDRPYSYAMIANDTTLKYFTLQPEDRQLKIPIMRKAQQMSKYFLKLITAPWSPSPWMKTNNDWTNTGSLLPQYRQLWADYFVKYFRAYRLEGFEFWALTPQNEPEANTYLNLTINGMAWTRPETKDWVVNYLAPTLRRAGFGHLKIYAGDENRQVLPGLPLAVMDDEKSRKIFEGTAVHWYFDGTVPPINLDLTKQAFPEKPIIYSEACNGATTEAKVVLGSWHRGQLYASNIIETLNHWVSSWIDWNMALNLQGGPTYINNFVDSPILVNASADEFYKQPMYYALGHFSKFVPPGSVRIASTATNLNGLDHVAFQIPDASIVVVLLNKNETETHLVIEDPRKGPTRLALPPKSITTMKYWV